MSEMVSDAIINPSAARPLTHLALVLTSLMKTANHPWGAAHEFRLYIQGKDSITLLVYNT